MHIRSIIGFTHRPSLIDRLAWPGVEASTILATLTGYDSDPTKPVDFDRVLYTLGLRKLVAW